jgi:hypothetical protein
MLPTGAHGKMSPVPSEAGSDIKYVDLGSIGKGLTNELLGDVGSQSEDGDADHTKGPNGRSRSEPPSPLLSASDIKPAHFRKDLEVVDSDVFFKDARD